ncbi:hypothetical protein LEN26_010622 [Aphanomyces euteiches]|nr:hypothetical protein AeMF1_010838 [Aphanomyces euteiches]KAH9121533.1 hypothetical protein LEN26_010622 [Aphanomyces euteiches]KAH9182971.1 hypothetical protein AeNC1_015051 [Aphanomyces euteiches]
MEQVDLMLLAPPQARCLPSAATLAAKLPKIHISDEEKQRVSSMRQQSFRRLQSNHIRCAKVLHGNLHWRAVEFMDVGEEQMYIKEEARLREEIEALGKANAAIHASNTALVNASVERRNKRPREPETIKPNVAKTITSL